MLKKKGFTLTEILAVVAILGVLLLIAVPSINKVVDNSKLSASVSSAKNYVTGIQYKFAGNSENNSVKHYLVNNSNLSDVLSSGSYPTDGIVVMYNNKVAEANLCFNNKSVQFKDNEYISYDSDKYCHYIENAMLAYLEKNMSAPTDLDYLKINTDRITPDTKIVGLKYKNPEYLEYINCLKTNSSCESKYGYIPEEYIPNTDVSRITGSSEIAKVESENKGLVFVNNENDISNDLPSSYNLKEQNLVTAVKDQGSLGTCWAHATTSAIESTILKKMEGNSSVELSPRHFDYFSSSDGISNLSQNLYVAKAIEDGVTKERKLGEGGNFSIALNSLTSGLTLQTKSKFKSAYEKTKKSAGLVFNSDRQDYFVTEATELSFDTTYNSGLENAINKVKDFIYNDGALVAAIDADKIVKQSDNYVLYDHGETNHAILLIGWDDNFTYKDQNNQTKKGAWIAQNSWGNSKSYFYISYNYNQESFYQYLGGFKSVEEKTWDNVYDMKNNITSGSVTVPNTFNSDWGDFQYDYLYLNKANDHNEKIVNIGYKKIDGINYASTSVKLIDAKDLDDCKQKVSANFNNINGILYSDNIPVGIEIEMPEIGNSSFFVDNINSDYIFKNDICVTGTYAEFGITSIFTKDVNSSTEKKIEIKQVSQNELTYQIDTVVSNIGSGQIITYTILDSFGKDISKSVTISDNVIVNNVAHTKITLPSEYQYKVIAKVGEIKSNELVINEGIIDKIPECYWNSTSDKVTSKSPGTFYLTCSDESGFSDTNLTRINIKPSSIFKLIINKISEPQISSDGKKATWTVKVSRVWFASGTAKLMLEKNSVKDINGNGNEKIETSPIKISRK